MTFLTAFRLAGAGISEDSGISPHTQCHSPPVFINLFATSQPELVEFSHTSALGAKKIPDTPLLKFTCVAFGILKTIVWALISIPPSAVDELLSLTENCFKFTVLLLKLNTTT